MSTVFTFPGKMGDALHQWPVAFHWAKQSGHKFECWMDEATCKPLVPLFEAQPCVESVKLITGVENYNCGGQPFHMNLPTSEFNGHTVFHLGLRGFPVRQLTMECLQTSHVPVKSNADALAHDTSLVVEGMVPKNRLVLHGQASCPHTKNTPAFWKFLAGIRGELEGMFDEIVFVGSNRDREVGVRTYAGWGAVDDGGSFLELARIIGGARAMIGCGSAPIVMAGLLKVPGIRVHDRIGNDAPKVIWSNLGDNQLNDTEVELRKSWPKWRDRWLLDKAVDLEPAVS